MAIMWINRQTKKTKNSSKTKKQYFWENVCFWLKGFFGFPRLIFFDTLIDRNPSKNKTQCVFCFFHFKTKKTRENKKNNLLSQDQTFSQKCFLFCLSFFLVFQVLFAFLDAAQDKYGCHCRHYWLHERVKQMIGWSRPGGEVVRQKF